MEGQQQQCQEVRDGGGQFQSVQSLVVLLDVNLMEVKMTIHNFIENMNNRLTIQECDFLIDMLMSSRDETIAKTHKTEVKTVIEKLAAQADLLEGINNKFND